MADPGADARQRARVRPDVRLPARAAAGVERRGTGRAERGRLVHVHVLRSDPGRLRGSLQRHSGLRSGQRRAYRRAARRRHLHRRAVLRVVLHPGGSIRPALRRRPGELPAGHGRRPAHAARGEPDGQLQPVPRGTLLPPGSLQEPDLVPGVPHLRCGGPERSRLGGRDPRRHDQLAGPVPQDPHGPQAPVGDRDRAEPRWLAGLRRALDALPGGGQGRRARLLGDRLPGLARAHDPQGEEPGLVRAHAGRASEGARDPDRRVGVRRLPRRSGRHRPARGARPGRPDLRPAHARRVRRLPRRRRLGAELPRLARLHAAPAHRRRLHLLSREHVRRAARGHRRPPPPAARPAVQPPA